MTTEMPVDQTLDCTGMLCPLPIVKLSKAFKTLEQGQVLLLLATDPGSAPDIEAWKKRTGNELIQQSKEDKVFKFWLRKTA